MTSLLKIKENHSIFWIHGIKFSSETCFVDLFWWIQKNDNSDFCYEFIFELNWYVFMYLNSQGKLWFVEKHPKAAQYNQLNTWKHL